MKVGASTSKLDGGQSEKQDGTNRTMCGEESSQSPRQRTQQPTTSKRGRWSTLEVAGKTAVEETKGQSEQASTEAQSTILPDDDQARSASSQRPNDVVSVPWQSESHGWLFNQQYQPRFRTIVYNDLIYYQGSSISQPRYLFQMDPRCGQTPPTRTFFCDCCQKTVRHGGFMVAYRGGFINKT